MEQTKMKKLLKHGLWVCLCMFTLSGQAVADSMADAFLAYEEGNYEKAAMLLREQAVQGNAVAQARLGAQYEQGKGVPQDFKEAYKWIHLAVAQGNADAQFTLGWMYELGEGVPLDAKEAINWYRLSAVNGNAHAQLSLGSRYLTGVTVLQDFEEALKWHRLSAEQGNVYAQFSLGSMYAHGKGVPQNFVVGHMWTNICSANATDFELLQLSIKLRDSLAKEMTAKQIAEAQELARKCTANKFKGC
jgi:uncharacterized protein